MGRLLRVAVAVACALVSVTSDAAVEAAGAAARAGRAESSTDAVAQKRAARRKVKRRMSKRNADGRVAEGVWGGPHVRLSVRADGAWLDFDCARGQVSGPFKTDADGRFDLPGTYTREGPGPIRLKHLPKPVPVHYSGRVEGSTLTLSVRMDDPPRSLGEYRLTHGDEGRVTKCR